MRSCSLAVLGLALCLVCAGLSANSQASYELGFSAREKNGIPVHSGDDEFDCSNQIYTIINAENLGEEPVNVTVIWRNPSGQIQEKTPVALYPVNGRAFGWAWLKLHKSTGAALFGFFDDSIGMDDFIGDWEVGLVQDDDNIAEGGFTILC